MDEESYAQRRAVAFWSRQRQTEQVISKNKLKMSGNDIAKVNLNSIWNSEYMGPRVYPFCLSHLDTGIHP